MRRPLPIIIALAAALHATPLVAERVELADGRTLSGDILYQNDELILLNLAPGGHPVTVKRSEIIAIHANDVTRDQKTRSTRTPAGLKDGPTFVCIPLRGEIGYAIDHELLKQALGLARQSKPDVLILEIDSDGGSVESAIEIMGTLTLWRHETHIPLVAFVNRRALSAASWLEASCDEIYVSPAALIGGALIYHGKPGARDTPLGMKMESIFLSGIRGGIRDAGKNPLLIDAMIDPKLTVSYAVTTDGQPLIWQGKPTDAPPDRDYRTPPQLLVGPDQILTLTAEEALATGLANKRATSVDAILNDLDIPPDHVASTVPAQVFEQHYQELQSVISRYERLVESLDQSLVTGKNAVTPVDRDEYIRLIKRLQRVRNTIAQMKNLGKQHEWIAERITQDLKRPPDDVLGAIDGQITVLKQSMPKPKRSGGRKINVISRRQ